MKLVFVNSIEAKRMVKNDEVYFRKDKHGHPTMMFTESGEHIIVSDTIPDNAHYPETSVEAGRAAIRLAKHEAILRIAAEELQHIK
jgi:hypothetical protein